VVHRYLPRWLTATWTLLIFTIGMIIVWAVTGSLAPVVLWSVALATLAVLWIVNRPRQNIRIYGPNGQEWMVSAATAERRVRSGWSYEPQASRP